MIDIAKGIHSLSDFKRNTSDFLEQMRSSGNPLVLTINGKAELVVQDAASYQELLNRVEQAETHEAIQRGIEQSKRGEGISVAEAEKRLRAKHGFSC